MYQQTPQMMDGALFRREYFQDNFIRRAQLPSTLRPCRYWDWAYTEAQVNKSDADWTVGVKMAFDYDAYFTWLKIYIIDMVRTQSSWTDVKRLVRFTAELDGKECFIGGEANGPQKAAMADLMSDPRLAGYTIWPLVPVKDKVARAQPWLDRARTGMVSIVVPETFDGERGIRDSWIEVFFDEGDPFPNGLHEDTIDGVSGGYEMCAMRVATGSVSAKQTTEKIMTRW
jgi:phage terminase large subunit-like protein